MFNENILITEQDLEFAQKSCIDIEEEAIRSRAVANLLACKVSERFFEDLDIDNKTSICQALVVQKLLDISDIYIKDFYIDVRFYFDEQAIYIPASHKKLGIEPVAYMFIKLNEDISGGVVTGFLPSQSVQTNDLVDNYYKISESDLVSYFDIEPLLSEVNEIDLNDDIVRNIFDFVDGKIEAEPSILSVLLASKEAREKFLDIVHAEKIVKSLTLEKNFELENTISESVEEESFGLEEVSDVEVSLGLDQEMDHLEDFSNVDFESLEEQQDDFPISVEDSLMLDLNADSLNEIEEFGNNDLDDNFTEFDDSSDYIQLNSLDDSEISDTELTEDLSIDDVASEFVSQDEMVSIDFSDELNVDLDEQEESLAQFESDFSTETTPSMREIEEISSPSYTEPDSELDTITVSEDSIESAEEIEVSILTEEPLSEIENVEIVPKYNDVIEEEISSNQDLSETNKMQEENDDIIPDFLLEDDTEEISIPQTQEEGMNSEKQIDKLFNKSPYDESDEEVLIQEPQEDFIPETNEATDTPKQKSLLPIIGAAAIVCSVVYFGFTKFNEQNLAPAPKVENNLVKEESLVDPVQPSSMEEENVIEDAMPIETIENKTEQLTEEPVSVSIPAIEKNLDASILVSNLSIGWQVPQSYLKQTSAKKYFTRLGKILQFNLKTELLLLNKPPITNKITVELKYNKSNSVFEVEGIVNSSGENVVDSLILQTIKNVLTTFKPEFEIEENSGHPILIINL